nr:MAG TPA: hypothetical protein [Caudoviricetes sp.]
MKNKKLPKATALEYTAANMLLSDAFFLSLQSSSAEASPSSRST